MVDKETDGVGDTGATELLIAFRLSGACKVNHNSNYRYL